MNKTRLIAVVLCLAAVVSACGSGYDDYDDYDHDPGPPPPSPAVPGPAPRPAPTQPDDEPYDSVYYENPGVDPFVDAEDDWLSTFALDIDTGSYTVGRRYLSDGNLPEKDSVRLEEYVNFFDQDYPHPPLEQGLGLTVDGGSTPFMQNQRDRVVRIGVQASEEASEWRGDANLVFVVDTSGSMERENRLGLVKHSLSLLVSALRPGDTVAIVEYGSHARVLLEPTPVGEEGTILRVIDSLRPGGSTNAAEGIQIGYRLANHAFRPGGINRVILCSDGVANVGAATDAEGILNLIQHDAERGIEMVTVGFGMGNYNDVLMERLADRGDGFYAYVDTPEEARRVFVDELDGTIQTVAKEAKIQVEFDPGAVQSWRLIGFENRSLEDHEFHDDSVDAGDIGAGHTVTALYEIKPREKARGDLGLVKLRWTDPVTGSPREVHQPISAASLSPVFERTSPRFQLDVVVAQYAEVLRESFWADQTDTEMDDVAEWAGYVARILPGDDDVKEFAALASRAAALSSR